jgi:hypothetical protein
MTYHTMDLKGERYTAPNPVGKLDRAKRRVRQVTRTLAMEV